MMLLCYCVMFTNACRSISIPEDHWMLIVAWKILLSHTLRAVCAKHQAMTKAQSHVT